MEKLFRLREWRDEDVPSLVEYAGNKKIFDNVRDSFPHPYIEENAKAWIQKNKGIIPLTAFAIEVDGKAVGDIGIKLKNDVDRLNAELGYWLGEPYWNRGIITAAVKEMIGYTFRNFDVIRIYACAYGFNKGSMRVLEKAGFELEAILKKSIIKNNVIADDYIYAILRS